SEFLYLATPIGPVTLAWDGNWRKAGSDRYDLTALAASPSRPGRLYAAGRPPAGTQLPDPLGLIRSQDGGRTWLLVSGQGRLAFTALAAGRGPEGDVLYGWDAAGRTLLHS